jgi:hypothetical protein
LLTELLLPRYDARDLGVELSDVDGLAGILGFDIRADSDVVVVCLDVLMAYELGEVVNICAGREGIEDLLLILRCQLVLLLPT